MKIICGDSNFELSFETKNINTHSKIGDMPELQELIRKELGKLNDLIYARLVTNGK